MSIKTSAATPKENLRKSTFLNALTSIIDFGAKLLVGFILNPIMVTILGPIYFGAWQVISQLNSYMATADIRAATSLKFILSRNRSISTDYELKKAVSSALYSNLIFIPLYLVAGTFIIWYAPILAGVEKTYFLPVRTATALLVVSFITTQFFFLFESTLQGMNLAYKRIGIRAIIVILGGIATGVVLYRGYGIVGMAGVQIAISILTGISFWWIVKKELPWFGFVKVKANEIISFIKLSGWYMLMKFADLISQSIDMILLGYLAGPKYVASYAITKYAMTAGAGIVKTISNAASVGIGKFIGENDFKKLIAARSQLANVQWLLLGICGFVVSLFNQAFINLWTKESLFSGQIATFFIVLIAVVNVLSQIDSSIINNTLNVKKKIVISLISAAVIITLAFVLVPFYKTSGLLLAILIGYLFVTFAYSFQVRKLTKDRSVFKSLFFNRIALASILLISFAVFLADFIKPSNWFLLILEILLAGLLISVILFFVGIKKHERSMLLNSFKNIRK